MVRWSIGRLGLGRADSGVVLRITPTLLYCTAPLPLRIVRQLHYVIETPHLIVAPDLKNIHQTYMRPGDRLEFLNALEFTFVGPLIVELPAEDYLYSPQGPHYVSGQPHLTIGTLTNQAHEVVVRNVEFRFGGSDVGRLSAKDP